MARVHTKYLLEVLEENLGGRDNITSGIEIGVWKAENAVALLTEFPKLHLHLVDPYDKDTGAFRRTSQDDYNNSKLTSYEATRFASDRVTFVYEESSRASELIAGNTFDFVFVDANHDYEHVKKDLDLWSVKVRRGGIVSGHDYGGRPDRLGRYGVKRAVDEFASSNRIELNVTPKGQVWWYMK